MKTEHMIDWGKTAAEIEADYALVCQQRDELLEALVKARNALQLANDTKNGPICDTIWMPSLCSETLFDFMDAAIASVKGKPCESCGGSGDIHRADGEWISECRCVKGCDAEFLSKRLGRVCTRLGVTQPFGDHEKNAEVAGTTLAAVDHAVEALVKQRDALLNALLSIATGKSNVPLTHEQRAGLYKRIAKDAIDESRLLK